MTKKTIEIVEIFFFVHFFIILLISKFKSQFTNQFFDVLLKKKSTIQKMHIFQLKKRFKPLTKIVFQNFFFFINMCLTKLATINLNHTISSLKKIKKLKFDH